jgi:hypothetical protein
VATKQLLTDPCHTSYGFEKLWEMGSYKAVSSSRYACRGSESFSTMTRLARLSGGFSCTISLSMIVSPWPQHSHPFGRYGSSPRAAMPAHGPDACWLIMILHGDPIS